MKYAILKEDGKYVEIVKKKGDKLIIAHPSGAKIVKTKDLKPIQNKEREDDKSKKTA